MLIMFNNCIAYDDLDDYDLEVVQTIANKFDDGCCWHQILKGDESVQYSIGGSFTWTEILKGDYSDGYNAIIAPIEIRNDIDSSLTELGFTRKKSCCAGQDKYTIGD